MAGDFYNRLPKELRRAVNEYYPNGGRPRITPKISVHNPDYREDRNKQICRKCNEGLQAHELAELFNLSKRTIRRILKENGIPYEVSKKSGSHIEMIKVALEMNMGKTEIAKQLGISRERVYQIIRKEGLEK